MASSFDPYLNWLGIPQSQRPISYYGLLGIKVFEHDAESIAKAAEKRAVQLRNAVRATNSPDYQRILKEIAAARDCLLDPELKQRYDQKLRGRAANAAAPKDELATPTRAAPPSPSAITKLPSISTATPTAASTDVPIVVAPPIRMEKPPPSASPPKRSRRAPVVEEPIDAIYLDPPRAQGTPSQRPRRGKRWVLPAIGGGVLAVALVALVTFAILRSEPSGVSNPKLPERPKAVAQPRAVEEPAGQRPLRLLPVVEPTAVVGRTYKQQFHVEFAAHWASVAKYAIEGNVPQGATLDTNRGLLVWTPTPEQADKTFQMTVRVTGTKGYSYEKSLTARAIAPPQPPPSEASERKISCAPLKDPSTKISLEAQDAGIGTAQATLQPLLRLGPHGDPTYLTHAAFSRSGQWLALSNHSQVYVWLVTGGGSQAAPLSARHHKTFFAPEVLAPAPDDGLQNKSRKKKKPPLRPIAALCFSPDERQLVIARDDGEVSIWDTASGAVIRQFKSFPSGLSGYYLRDVAYLPDGKDLVVACSNKALFTCNVETGARMERLPSSSESPRRLLVYANGARLLLAREKSIAALELGADSWTTAWEANLRGEGHQMGIGVTGITPDGRTLVSGDAWGVLTSWDLSTGGVMRTMQAHDKSIRHLAFLGNGEVMVTSFSSGDEGGGQLWNTATMARVGNITGHVGPLRAMAVSADGCLLATAGQQDKSVIVWRYEWEEPPAVAPSPERAGAVAALENAAAMQLGRECRLKPLTDPMAIAGRTYKQKIQVEEKVGAEVRYTIESGAPPGAAIDAASGWFTWQPSAEQIHQRHRIVVRATRADGAADVREMIATAIPGYEKFPQDVTERQIPWQAMTDPPVQWNLDGQSGAKGALRPVLKLGPIPGNAYAKEVVLSHNGQMVAACVRGEILLWSLKQEEGMNRKVSPAVSGMRTLVGHRERPNMGSNVNAARFTPDGSRLVSGGHDGTVRVWDTASGNALHVLGGQSRIVRDLAMMSDGAAVVAADGSSELKLWDIVTGKQAGKTTLFRSKAHQCVLSPRGKQLAMIDENSKVLLCGIGKRGFTSSHYLTPDDEPADVPPSEDYRAMTVCFSPDGKLFVTGDNVETFTVWDAERESKVRSVKAAPHGSVHWMAFLGKGEVLVTSSSQGMGASGFLWNIATGERLGIIPGHQGTIRGVSVSGDGRRLATLGSQDKSIIIWEYERE